MEERLVRVSKFLSLVLRHRPEKIGLTLDAQGWADVSELIAKCSQGGMKLSLPLLQDVVRENDKQRFIFSEDETKIRANQGHSVSIDLALPPLQPPATLYHGTASRFIDSIREQGLLRGSRQHVHLSEDKATAVKVGQRHGKPVVLRVVFGKMWEAGELFFRSENGVWLTEHVRQEYIEFPE